MPPLRRSALAVAAALGLAAALPAVGAQARDTVRATASPVPRPTVPTRAPSGPPADSTPAAAPATTAPAPAPAPLDGAAPVPAPAPGAAATAPAPPTSAASRGTAPRDTAPTRPRVSAAAARAFSRERLLSPLDVPFRGGSPAAVLHVQVMLSAAGFSPGALDGRWGENMRLALRAYREASGLAEQPVDVVDADTYARLRRAAHDRPAVTSYAVSAADVRGPYPPLPASVADKAKAPCLCYESLLERLGERFHVTQHVLRAMNPGATFDSLRAGDTLTVPNTWRLPPPAGVARVLVDKEEGAVRGVDGAGALVFWLPATVGSADMPSPDGSLTVRRVTRNPYYRWDPAVLRDVDDRAPVRMLPPGPNSLVGSVWVALSRAHLGIHGTAHPESVGYAASHGCVRLTNWDALWFAAAARPGLPVEFR